MDEKLEEKPKSKRGFAALTPSHHRDISSMGGRAAHLAGSAHEFTPAEARKAGSKGGKVAHERRAAAKRGDR